MSATVQGYCPMGCGRTLFLNSDGYVNCSRKGCPNPGAVASLLADPETEHIVVFKRRYFNLQHPLRERLDGELLDCPIHQNITNLSQTVPPIMDGRYRAFRNDVGALQCEPLDQEVP